MVARASRTLAHHDRGWNRSSTVRQPPTVTIAITEFAIAFMWNSGSGVSIRSGGVSDRSTSPPSAAYQSPEWRKYSFASTHPLGRPVVPEV